MNPCKVPGQCGRLKCCLVYEQETYAELRKGLPKLGKRVITDEGEGRVVEVDVLRQRVRVSLVQGDGQVYAAEQVRPPTMTRLVTALEDAGLVVREPDPEDGRLTPVRATAKGKMLLSQGRARRVAALTAEVRSLSDVVLSIVSDTN